MEEDNLAVDNSEMQTRNVVYLITCTKCGQNYVSQTSRQLADRFNEEREEVRANVSGSKLARHYNSNGHNEHNMRIHILDEMDQATEYERKTQETKRIYQFNTYYNGLNMSRGLGGAEYEMHMKAISIQPQIQSPGQASASRRRQVNN
jgi:hypothetical protein